MPEASEITTHPQGRGELGGWKVVSAGTPESNNQLEHFQLAEHLDVGKEQFCLPRASDAAHPEPDPDLARGQLCPPIPWEGGRCLWTTAPGPPSLSSAAEQR